MHRILPSEGKLVYHTTHAYNIPSIIANGLQCRKMLETSDLDFYSIGDSDMLEKRRGLYENYDLSLYVPFHFFPRTPFERSICNEYGNEKLAVVSVSREFVYNRKDSAIIPSHPLSSEHPPLFSYKYGIGCISWDILDDYDSYSNEYDYTDHAIRNKTMAECLIPYKVFPQDIEFIYVYSKKVKDILISIIGDQPVIEVNPYILPHKPFNFLEKPYMESRT